MNDMPDGNTKAEIANQNTAKAKELTAKERAAAEAQALAEIVSDDSAFLDATCDFMDLLSYALTTDAQIDKEAAAFPYRANANKLHAKRRLAKQACESLRACMDGRVADMASIRNALLAASQYAIDGRADDIIAEQDEARSLGREE